MTTIEPKYPMKDQPVDYLLNSRGIPLFSNTSSCSYYKKQNKKTSKPM